jgi:hypothetical protein
MQQITTSRGTKLYKPSLSELTELDHDSLGLCVACGEVQPAEPDARKYRCDCCAARGVYGAAELVLMGFCYAD